MQNSNDLFIEDLLRQHQKRQNHEDIPGPDLKKARNLNVVPSPLLAGSSNNVIFERIESITSVSQPHRSVTIDLCNGIDQPMQIQEPQIPRVEYVQHQMQPTEQNSNNFYIEDLLRQQQKRQHHEDIPDPDLNKPRNFNVGPTPLLAGSANNVILERIVSINSVSHPHQSDSIDLCNDINQPMQMQEPLIPRVEYIQNQMQPTTSNYKYCIEIYQKLRAMFPNIDREYIKIFCPADWIPGVSREIQFNNIVDRIFLNEHSWVMAVTPNNSSSHGAYDDDLVLVPNVDDTYEQLTVIFPNADPLYLRSAAEKFKNENDISAFINEKLQNNDYPTREQYLAKMKVTEEQQRYTKDFNVEQFLTLFPDPFKHFENNTRQCTYNLIAIEFLKNMFSRVRANTINKLYRQCKYNISITAKQLKNNTDFISKPRRVYEIPTDNIHLLQEMAFVRHMEKIHQHLEMVKQREEEEFNLLKAAGGLWTCQCCFDEECMPSKCSTCDNGHIFCNSCIISGTDSKLGDGETHVPCFLDCGCEFSIATFQKVLPPTKLCIFLKKRQSAEVMAAGLEGLVFCPFCDFASIPAAGDKVFKCFNPECMKESCILCKEPNHIPYRCGEVEKKDKARKYIEEKMTQAMTRTCYKCNKTFFKEEGCNKMVCTCGAMMCYICSQPVDPAVGYKHFRGQGSHEVGKCPLWTDNKVLNAETVRKVEEEARREIQRQDPTLNINTTVLAPAVPRPTPGPHDGTSNTNDIANILAARVLSNDRFDVNRAPH